MPASPPVSTMRTMLEESSGTLDATITQGGEPAAVVCHAFAHRDALMVWEWGGRFEVVDGRLVEGDAEIAFDREGGPIVITSVANADSGSPQTGVFTGRGFPPADIR